MKSQVLPIIVLHRKRWRLLLLLTSFLASILGLMAPYFQKLFIDQFSMVFIWSSFFCLLGSQALNQLTNYLGTREALIAQKKLSEKIYSQILSLKVDTLSERSSGEVVSLYATDVPGSTILLEQTLPQGTTTFFPLILAPIALALTLKTHLVWTLLGIFFVSGFNTALAFRQSKFFFTFKQLAAQRTGLVSEWINNIKGLRILGWTETFEDKIIDRRTAETRNRVKMVTNGQVMNSVSSSMTFVLNVMTLATLVYFSDHLPTVGEILSCLWIIGVFLTRPFRQMPWFFTFAFDGWTSIKRIDQFLKIQNLVSPPMEKHSQEKNDIPRNAKVPVVLDVKNLNLKLPHHPALLKNISFSIQAGEFVALVGEVGSGKSLFLLSLMKETGASFESYKLFDQPIDLNNESSLKKFFSYVPQESFIMSAKLGQNILFDYEDIEPQKNQIAQALRAAQFNPEEERFPTGLFTEIGEKGVNLSGGQKQRISLARAIYHDRDIMLIDDGFSNLDIKTEEALLDQLFFKLWKNKTKILATHRLTVLPKTDRILFFKNGEIIDQGTFSDLIQRNAEFKEFTSSLTQEESPQKAEVITNENSETKNYVNEES